MENELKNILSSAQITTASHQKKLRVLKSYYEKVPEEEFYKELFKYLKKILFQSSFPTKNEYVERILDFLAQFVSLATPVNEIENDFSEDSIPEHSCLTKIVTETLKYHNSCFESLRYNSCFFVRLILQHIGCQINLHNEILDTIQDAMLERAADPKSSIRLQAVMALVRLQEPTNPDCPVIKAFLSLIIDGNALIRAEVVKTIAPFSASIPQIVNRLRDIDHNVRLMAFRRCADLVPKFFKIVERQRIMKCGLSETQPKLKKVFLENLLAKWVHAYNENYVVFLKALKLDATESDIVAAEDISRQVMNLLFSIISMKNVIENLSLDEKKVIPIQTLTSEAVNLWNITVNYLRNNEDMDEYLENILPELTAFCAYIESIFNEKKKRNTDDWEDLSFQHILLNLLDIVEGYDFSDEVGRKNLYELLMRLIKEEDLQSKVKNKLISIASELTPKNEDFTSTICHIISEIREPLTALTSQEASPNTDMECRAAMLRVEIITLRCKLEEATDKQEFIKADSLKRNIEELQVELSNCMPQTTVEMVKVSKDDPKTVCGCLDILVALLALPRVHAVTPSLVTVKDEFVIPLLESNVVEINWRVISCLSLYCYLDEELAEQYAKIICFPIITYRETIITHKSALIVSIKSVCDLFLIYGANIFGSTEDSNSTNQANQTRRRLYRNDDGDESSTVSSNRFQLEYIIEIMLDMLDDENAEIRHTCGMAIYKLILSNFPVTPFLITRIFLKWYNPLTVTYPEDQLQQILGSLIETYTSTISTAREVISKAIIPILTSIASAPVTSPLAEVDVDNLIQFLSAITNSNETRVPVNTHLSMAHAYCYEMMKKKNAPIVHYLSKFLLRLDIPMGNSSSVKELISEVEIILTEKNLLEKASQKNMQKFLDKLNARMEEQNGITTLETIHESTHAEASNSDVSNNSSRYDSNVDNRDRCRMSTKKPDPTKENQKEAVDDSSQDKDVSVGKEDPNKSPPVNAGKKVRNKKRTRTKQARHRKERSEVTNDLLETESDSLTTDSEAGRRCIKPLNKKLKVCIFQTDLNALQIDKNTKPDDSSTKQNIDKDKSAGADSSDKSTSEDSLQTDENLRHRLTNSDSAESNRTENSDSNTSQERENNLPDTVDRPKRRIKSKTIGKNNGGLGSQRSDNESYSDLEKGAKRLSKRLKLQSLDLNKVEKVDGRRHNLLLRSKKQKRSTHLIDRKHSDIQNSSKTIKKTRSRNSDTGVSKDFDSDQDTILHTIIHDISQNQETENISSFSSPNGSFGSQRSLRSNNSSNLSLSTKNGSKVIDSERTSQYYSLRHSARKVK